MHWDGEVVYQSRRRDAYAAALARLERQGVVYPCACSRREIADSGMHGNDGPVYPGTCRAGLAPGKFPRAWRVRVGDATLGFDDAVQGVRRSALAEDIGDFVVKRADGLFAYQLAVVVDDAEIGVTEVVRGADLLDSTPRQMLLQRMLGMPTPAYLHLPVVLNAEGEKLSKQTRATALDRRSPVTALWAALDFLGQAPDPAWRDADLESFWREAVCRWSPGRVPRQRAMAPRAAY
jgi:glutamyl-Q tRNA(Asp) synthetase